MTHILITDLREIRYMAYVPEEPKEPKNKQEPWLFKSEAHHDAWADYERGLEKAKRESIEFDRVEDRIKIIGLISSTIRIPCSLLDLEPDLYQVPVEVEVVHFKNEKDADVASGYSHPPQKFARLKSSEPKPESQESKLIDILTMYKHFENEESIQEVKSEFPKHWAAKRLETCHWLQTIGKELQGKEVNQ